MDICTILIASALTLGSTDKAVFHSVQFYDHQTRVSERVLDRSICKDIERVYPLTTLQGAERVEEKVRLDREGNRKAVEKHCKGRVRSEGKDASECLLAL